MSTGSGVGNQNQKYIPGMLFSKGSNSASGATDIDMSAEYMQSFVFTGDVTFSIANIAEDHCQHVVCVLTANGADRDITWATGLRFKTGDDFGSPTVLADGTVAILKIWHWGGTSAYSAWGEYYVLDQV